MDNNYHNIGLPEDKLIEEIGEVLQAIGKQNRFGYFNHHPERVDSTNVSETVSEVSDLIRVAVEYKGCLETIIECGDLNERG